MIDFQKTNISHVHRDFILSHPKLKFNEDIKVDLQTGTIIKQKAKNYHNLVFAAYRKTIILEGSIHKLHNMMNGNGAHNYNDFNFDQLQSILQHLAHVFCIDLSRAKFENLEYGVNIEVPIPSERIVKDHIILLDGRTPNEDKPFDGKGQYKQWKFSEYLIKVYAKSLQYNLDTYVLRFEVKAIKNRPLSKFDISTLADLNDKSKLLALRDDLLQHFDKLLIVDSLTSETIIEPSDRRIYERGINPFTWQSFSNRTAKKRFKDQFDQVLHKYKRDTLKSMIRNRIYDKWNELLCYNFTDLSEQPQKEQNVTKSHLVIVGKRNKQKEEILNKKIKQASKRKRDIRALCFIVKSKNEDGTLRLFTKLHNDYYFIKRLRNQKSNPFNNELNNFRRKLMKMEKRNSYQKPLFEIPIEMSYTKREFELIEILKEKNKDTELLKKLGI